MYKTVKHGENSLQYKILAQQEEGAANVKYRKSSRGRTAGVITVILLLICGVIATAVLVPLVFTNDFITLTGTFQKFSVSTLRRSHSGNHVVVIAKKPHGWNASHQSVFPSALKSTPDDSLSHLPNKTKETTIQTEPSPKEITPEASTTTPTKQTTVASKPEATTRKEEVTEAATTTTKAKSTVPSTEEVKVQGGSEYPAFPVIQKDLQVQGNFPPTLKEASSTNHPNSWHRRENWGFSNPTPFSDLPKTLRSEVYLSVTLFCTTLVIIFGCLINKKCSDIKKARRKKAAEQKEDNASLLKSPARVSDEE